TLFRSRPGFPVRIDSSGSWQPGILSRFRPKANPENAKTGRENTIPPAPELRSDERLGGKRNRGPCPISNLRQGCSRGGCPVAIEGVPWEASLSNDDRATQR